MLRIKCDVTKVVTLLTEADKRIIQGQVSGLNKLAKQAKTTASKEIRKEYGVNVKGLNEGKTLTYKEATVQRLISEVSGTGRGISLKYFGARQVKSGVSVAVKKGKRKILTSAFGPNIARLGGNVFERAGKERTPIVKKFGPGAALMLKSKPVLEGIKTYIGLNYKRIMDHEIQYFMKK